MPAGGVVVDQYGQTEQRGRVYGCGFDRTFADSSRTGLALPRGALGTPSTLLFRQKFASMRGTPRPAGRGSGLGVVGPGPLSSAPWSEGTSRRRTRSCAGRSPHSA